MKGEAGDRNDGKAQQLRDGNRQIDGIAFVHSEHVRRNRRISEAKDGSADDRHGHGLPPGHWECFDFSRCVLQQQDSEAKAGEGAQRSGKRSDASQEAVSLRAEGMRHENHPDRLQRNAQRHPAARKVCASGEFPSWQYRA
ncbi:MAG: hypothetical protein LKM32_08610 [Chiayiivirga sp.]|nr:hypothetical protein [Chiayiivirga sp.]MCI1729416.1 hypothetical protein [Chiayiivirga sp.]